MKQLPVLVSFSPLITCAVFTPRAVRSCLSLSAVVIDHSTLTSLSELLGQFIWAWNTFHALCSLFSLGVTALNFGGCVL